MGGLSPWHLLFAGIVILLLFGGRGKISSVMGDTAKGIRAFREGLKGEDEAKKEEEEEVEPAKPLPRSSASAKASTAKKTAARSTAKSKA